MAENGERLKVHANPAKSFFVSMLIKDITLRDAIGDLVDNAVDAIKACAEDKNDLSGYKVVVTLDENEFIISDNGQGMSTDIARTSAFNFGKAKDHKLIENSIGQFGIGMKRAFFKIGSFISVHSVTKKSKFDIDINVPDWLAVANKWEFAFKEDTLQENVDQLEDTGFKVSISDLSEDAKENFNNGQFINQLQNEIRRQADICRATAARLSDKRKACASTLEKNIENELKDLNMPSVVFKVQLLPVDNEAGFDRSGAENAYFLMSANAGELPGRISKVASGGELSRIMLAMKNVFSKNDAIETMVFDEIDAGISGLAAQRVGEKLSDVSVGKQVICVTHLSQLAVMADQHYLIEKHEEAGRTYTNIDLLSEDNRRYEIARLHGGEHITDLTLASAQDQIDAASAYKRNRMIKEN